MMMYNGVYAWKHAQQFQCMYLVRVWGVLGIIPCP